MIRHVLFDADGVLQHLPGGWYAAMEPYLGDRARDFLHATWRDERPMLRGEGDYLPELARALREYGVPHPVEEVYAAVWHRIEVFEESVAVVHRLRAAGYGVHLGTNQEQGRAAYMRASLGYEELFDVCCYSCELGATKPDRLFFERAVERIGAQPHEVLFVDDSEPNVAGARDAGLPAVHWHVDRGHDELEQLLRHHRLAF